MHLLVSGYAPPVSGGSSRTPSANLHQPLATPNGNRASFQQQLSWLGANLSPDKISGHGIAYCIQGIEMLPDFSKRKGHAGAFRNLQHRSENLALDGPMANPTVGQVIVNKEATIMMTVGFLPWWPTNPYQILLKQGLNKLGIRVIGNPPLSLLRLLVGRDGLDVVHVHWPHGTYKNLFQFLYMLTILTAYRLLKNNVVWTVHELDAYESRHPRRDAWFRSVVMRLSCCLIVHGKHTRQELIEQHGYKRPINVVQHPSYVGWYKDEVNRKQARIKFGLPDDARVYLYFGYIKPYKGVEDLIDAFGQIRDDSAILLIAGKPLDDSIKTEVESLAAKDPRIRTFLNYIPDDDIQNFFHAADIAVFPFRHTQTSGSVMLALTFGCPVVAPRIGSLLEYVDADSSILFDPREGGGLAGALRLAESAPLEQMADAARTQAQRCTWTQFATVHADLYRKVIGQQ